MTETTSRQIDVLMFISYIDIAALLVSDLDHLNKLLFPYIKKASHEN